MGKSPEGATTAEVGIGAQRPQASREAAVKALLDAEQRGDHDASFQLLSSAALNDYPDAEAWTRRRTELPEITSFTISSARVLSESACSTLAISTLQALWYSRSYGVIVTASRRARCSISG